MQTEIRSSFHSTKATEFTKTRNSNNDGRAKVGKSNTDKNKQEFKANPKIPTQKHRQEVNPKCQNTDAKPNTYYKKAPKSQKISEHQKLTKAKLKRKPTPQRSKIDHRESKRWSDGRQQ